MERPRLSPAVRGAVGITLVALTVATVTVLLHRARFERALLALTEERLAFVAADVGARIQSGLDLGLDLPAMANVQAILDAEVQGDPAITAVEVIDTASKVLFRGGPADGAGVASDRLIAMARPEPDRAAGGEADVTGPGAADGAGAGVAWFDAGSGLIAGRSRLVDIFGGDAGSLVLTYSRSSVGEATGAMTSLLVRAVLLALPVTFGLAWLLTLLVLRERTRGHLEAPIAGHVVPGTPEALV